MLQGFSLRLGLAFDKVQKRWLKRVSFLIQQGRKCLEKQKRPTTGKFQDSICYITFFFGAFKPELWLGYH